MSTLTDTLQRILNWLLTNYPEAVRSLKPGLSYEEIEVKLADLPFHLPQEVYELYQWRNGMDGEANFFYYYTFLSLEESLERIKFWQSENFNAYIPFGWFPLFEFEGEWFAAIGAESKTENSPIVYIYHDESVAYTNLTGMMLTIAECYEKRIYYKDKDRDYWDKEQEKEQRVRLKYNSEVFCLVSDIEYKNYVQTHQQIKRPDGSILKTFYNPYSGMVAETTVEDIKGKLKEQAYYLGKQIIHQNTYRDRSEEFESYYSCERWYASHDRYEEITILGDRKISKTIKRRYINGILKEEQELTKPVSEQIKTSLLVYFFIILIFIILVVAIFLLIAILIAFIAFILASLITIIKWLMGERAAIYL